MQVGVLGVEGGEVQLRRRPQAHLGADLEALGGLVLKLEDTDDIQVARQVARVDHRRVRVAVGTDVETAGLKALHVGGVEHRVRAQIVLQGHQRIELLLFAPGENRLVRLNAEHAEQGV